MRVYASGARDVHMGTTKWRGMTTTRVLACRYRTFHSRTRARRSTTVRCPTIVALSTNKAGRSADLLPFGDPISIDFRQYPRRPDRRRRGASGGPPLGEDRRASTDLAERLEMRRIRGTGMRDHGWISRRNERRFVLQETGIEIDFEAGCFGISHIGPSMRKNMSPTARALALVRSNQ